MTTEPTVRTTPATARTDVTRTDPVPGDPGGVPAGPSARAVRLTGLALAVLPALWALAGPLGIGADAVLGAAVAVGFQGSLLALLALCWRTRATGRRTAGRILLGVETAVLGVAILQSVSEAVPGALADTLTAALDPTWPLSMLGMFVVGITVACVGRWRGPARVWAPVATSWIAFLPVMMMAPGAAGGYVAAGHILLGYVVLGGILAARPGLVERPED